MWSGGINDEFLKHMEREVKGMVQKDSNAAINLFINSGGGSLETALSFYEMTRLLRVNLVTVGLGEVSSAATIVFLSGRRRHVTPSTYMVLHPSSNSYKPGVRMGEVELSNQVVSFQHVDGRYAQIVHEHAGVLPLNFAKFKKEHTLLNAKKIVKLGFAHSII